MRIVCLIPSITETLINCQLNVVGRTRFCIHPQKSVQTITAVGGTKDINWSKVDALKPDLVILDKEENTLEMAQNCPYPYHVLHITTINSITTELKQLATVINSEKLEQIASRWEKVAQAPNKDWSVEQTVPATIALLQDKQNISARTINKIDYMIWRDPWMAIGPNTFIWSVLQKLGFAKYAIQREDKYPNLGDKLCPNNDTFYLFSSEPFPFERYKDELTQLGFQGAIIDGESYSWYGSRSLRFLEKQLSIS